MPSVVKILIANNFKLLISYYYHYPLQYEMNLRALAHTSENIELCADTNYSLLQLQASSTGKLRYGISCESGRLNGSRSKNPNLNPIPWAWLTINSLYLKK